MSFRAYYELNCDRDCGRAYPPDADEVCDPVRMERGAEREGWKVVGRNRSRTKRQHACPTCAAELAAPAGAEGGGQRG